ncbi:MAG: sulfatase-like hydrolase/transferase, partial [Pseudomonadales bacterium]
NLPLKHFTLAEALREAGYQTWHVGKWHLGDAAHYPEAHGFDLNIGGTFWGAPSTFWYPYRGNWGRSPEIRYVPDLPFGKPGEYLPDRLTDEAIRLINKAGDAPFFLNMWYHTVHTPIEGKEHLVPPMALAAVNQLYFFQPLASDLNGDQLEFAIVNKPPWLDFDSVSGIISGIPTAADVGSYGNIWINVSDGLNVASLGPFDIEVVAIGQDSVTLSWLPPTENEDGSPLMDLAGYRLRYGSNANSYPNLIDINNPGIVTFSVENLVPNTYYFVITAYNSSGVESTFSNEATITLN